MKHWLLLTLGDSFYLQPELQVLLQHHLTVCTNRYTKELDIEVIHKAQICNLKISSPITIQPGQVIQHFRVENLQHLKYLLADNRWLKIHNATNVDQAYNIFTTHSMLV
ncbi:hypothetical protein J6590_044644 [Homalodisca vitripennis]|nr:hypothetical protein J6590_044644 [Homalodisca vitripennis]